MIANLVQFCAHRRQRCAGPDQKPDFEVKSRNRRRKRCAALANSLTKKAPYKGLGADSEEKREPVSDINIAAVDSLKVLDPNRPIREEKPTWTPNSGMSALTPIVLQKSFCTGDQKFCGLQARLSRKDVRDLIASRKTHRQLR